MVIGATSWLTVAARRALGALAGLVAAAALAQTPPAPPTPPTFTCPSVTVMPPGTTNAVGAVLNTYAVNATDRGNQPRWEYANGGRTSTAPSSVPAGAAFSYFTGLEIANYPGGLSDSNSLSQVGFYPYPSWLQLPALVFYRYRFVLAPEVDPATYVLTISGIWADDAVTAIYMNGTQWTGTATPPLPTTYGADAGATAALGAGATADQQWHAGANEVVFAVVDNGGLAVRLRVDNAVGECRSALLNSVLAFSNPAPTITTADRPSFSGTITNVPDGTVVQVVVTDAAGAVQNLTATVTNGQWTTPAVTNTLAVGTYTVTASAPGVANPPASVSQQGTVTAAPVPTLTPAPLPATVSPTDTPSFSGTTTQLPDGTPVTIVVRDAAGNVQTLTATVTNGAYTSPALANPLAPGAFTVTTTITGLAPVVQNGVVRAIAAGNAVQAVPTLEGWALALLAALLAGVGVRRRQRV